MSHWSEALPKRACIEAVEWAKTQPDYETAWARCERADWMVWLIGQYDDSVPMSNERRPLVRCVLEIVELVRHLMPPASIKCVGLLARWCDGSDVTIGEMRDATEGAWDDARAASGVRGVWDAAGAAAWGAWDAARAAALATLAAGAAGAARDDALRSSADIVRRHYPAGPVLR